MRCGGWRCCCDLYKFCRGVRHATRRRGLLLLLRATSEARGDYGGRVRGTCDAGEAAELPADLCNFCKECRQSSAAEGRRCSCGKVPERAAEGRRNCREAVEGR